MKHIVEFITENEVSDFFKKQEKNKKKMIKRWKSDESLKPLDSYFKWKSKEISTSEYKSLSEDDIMDMMGACRGLSDKNYNANADDPEDWFKDSELAEILDAVEMELIKIYPLFK